MSEPEVEVTAENGAVEHATLWDALFALQQEALQIQRDAEGQVQNRKYKYVSLTAIGDKVLSRVSHHGLLWMTKPTIIDGEPALRYTMRHMKTGEVETDVMLLCVGTHPTPQDQGSGLTYARRYGIMALLNLVPVETDDDGARVPRSTTERKVTETVRHTILDTLDKEFPAPKDIPLFLGSIGVTNVPEDWTQSDRLKIRNALKKRKEAR